MALFISYFFESKNILVSKVIESFSISILWGNGGVTFPNLNGSRSSNIFCEIRLLKFGCNKSLLSSFFKNILFSSSIYNSSLYIICFFINFPYSNDFLIFQHFP